MSPLMLVTPATENNIQSNSNNSAVSIVPKLIHQDPEVTAYNQRKAEWIASQTPYAAQSNDPKEILEAKRRREIEKGLALCQRSGALSTITDNACISYDEWKVTEWLEEAREMNYKEYKGNKSKPSIPFTPLKDFPIDPFKF